MGEKTGTHAPTPAFGIVSCHKGIECGNYADKNASVWRNGRALDVGVDCVLILYW